MAGYIAPGKQITPLWLTIVLHQAGVLANGEVISIEYKDTGAFNSETIHLLPHYSTNTSPNVPTRLIIKRNANGDGEDEVKFYCFAARQTGFQQMCANSMNRSLHVCLLIGKAM